MNKTGLLSINKQKSCFFLRSVALDRVHSALLIGPDRVRFINCRVRIVTDDIYVLAVGCGDALLYIHVNKLFYHHRIRLRGSSFNSLAFITVHNDIDGRSSSSSSSSVRNCLRPPNNETKVLLTLCSSG